MNLLFMQNGLPPYGIPRSGLVSIIDPWRDTYGRNILPVASENFVTGWSAQDGETITVTDYPTTININGVETAIVAKRIQGLGNGSSIEKYASPSIFGLSNPHTSVLSLYAKSLNEVTPKMYDYIAYSSTGVPISNTFTQVTYTREISDPRAGMHFITANATDALDIVVYQPQVNIGTLYPYSPPAGLPQSTLDYSGHGNTFQLGSTAGSDTNDPKFNGVALVGDGDDYAVASFASAAYRISIVDSGSGYTFVNEVPAYLNLFKTGASTYLNGKIGPTAYYNRVLTAGEIAQSKAGLKRYMASKGVTVS